MKQTLYPKFSFRLQEETADRLKEFKKKHPGMSYDLLFQLLLTKKEEKTTIKSKKENKEEVTHPFVFLKNNFLEKNDEYMKMISSYKNKGMSEVFIAEQIAAFIAYWDEQNYKNGKHRFEEENHFDVTRRLATWFSRVRSPLGQKYDPGKEERDRKADEALRKKVAEREIFISQNPQYKQ